MDNPFSANYRFLALYNRWLNQRVYTVCEQLPEAARQQDLGAFFGSIQHTLNHLLVGDQIWLQRFIATGAAHGVDFNALTAVVDLPPGCTLDTQLYPDWASLKARREELDAAIETWLAQAPDDMASWTMAYTSMQGAPRQHPMWQALTHFFNHQTHHRGQVSTLLAQQGVDLGVTDLIALV